jgi:AraC-like DNA-binding protein
MTIKQILSEITERKNPLPPESYPKYQDVLLDNSTYSPFTFYPDQSRSIDDIISIIGMITTKGSPLVSILGSFLLHHYAEARLYYFDDGFQSPTHSHNYAELAYVVEGQFYTQIAGRDYLFNKGDIFLINRNIPHNEYLYRRNQAVLFLSIVNTFFDKSIHHDVYDNRTADFLKNFILGGKQKYQFVRFTPRGGGTITGLFENIITELWRPHPGSTHLIIGYVEWILNLLVEECDRVVQWKDRNAAGNALYKEIRRYLEDHYQNTTLDDLIEKFGHNMNYFNRLIKNHTGMTYSRFLQNIRLEKAEALLKTTGFTVEEIAQQSGYENVSYFYKIFQKKFDMTPKDLRKSILS